MSIGGMDGRSSAGRDWFAESTAPAPRMPVKRSSILTQTASDSRASKIRVGAIKEMLTPNARREFQQSPVAASASIETLVPFLNAASGEHIGIQAEDWGMLSGETVKGFATVNQNNQISLQYQALANDGLLERSITRKLASTACTSQKENC